MKKQIAIAETILDMLDMVSVSKQDKILHEVQKAVKEFQSNK